MGHARGDESGEPPRPSAADDLRDRSPWEARGELRRAILDRRLFPGQAVDARYLASYLRTSMAIAREVMGDLMREGLIESVGGGFAVMTPSVKEAHELDDMRSALQARVVRGFVANASDSKLRALRRAVRRFDELVRAGASPSDLFAAKEWFYGLLLRGCGNAMMIGMLARIRGRVHLFSTAALVRPGVPEATVADLMAIVEAVEARDAERAVRLCLAHLDRTRKVGLEVLAADLRG